MFNQKIKIMTQTERDMQLVESQPLTVKNAHRVAMIHKKESTEPPVPFHFRKKHLGMESFVIGIIGAILYSRKMKKNCGRQTSRTGK